MRIAIFNWRDFRHPKGGGAELATHQLAHGLAKRGHSVTWFTSHYAGAQLEEICDGYRIVRRGSELTCRFYGLLWLYSNRHNFDVVIDEVNTLPFLSRFVFGKRVVVLMHQLAREVWIAEAPPVLGHIGYAAERLFLSIYQNVPIVTISESSAASFREFGLRGKVHVAEIALRPPAAASTPVAGRIGYVGRIARSKRLDHIVRALAIVRKDAPHAHLTIVGSGSEKELRRLTALVYELGLQDAVTFCGRVDDNTRDALMSSFEMLVMTSLREGWGLVVSEAARFAVPSVVYPVAGLVDSVVEGKTGLVAASETPDALARCIVTLLRDREARNSLGLAAMEYLRIFDEDRFVGRWERVLLATRAS
jgi:glycosyltransferase involved in cell wall biosynthesis